MGKLTPAQRAALPDSAFAYVDSRGVRRLPIYDEPHVRNALARFGQVQFENDGARERARTRLLRAAKRHHIVPVGFISSQLKSEREIGRAGEPVRLPSGFVVLLMTDIEGSTALVQQLGSTYRDLINETRALLRAAVASNGGQVVEARADDFFAVFESPRAAVEAAIDIQRELRSRSWDGGLEVRVRIGIHCGYPSLAEANYIGMPVHVTARVCAAAHGGQTLVSGETVEALSGIARDGVSFKRLGAHRLRGIPDEVKLFQVQAKGLPRTFPPPSTARGAGLSRR